MGGETFVSALAIVDIYNPVTKSWRSGPPMIQTLHGLYPVVYKDRIIIPGESKTGREWRWALPRLTFSQPGGCPNVDRGVSNYCLVYEPA
jgi:hypothetical protein